MTKPSDTIESREPRYGDYYERSELKERIVEAFSEGRNWMGLEPDARNSLMMIADKLSRILNGDADDPDSWHDIGGYAELVEKRLNGNREGGPVHPFPPISSKRCPYLTGTPPSWDMAPKDAHSLVQSEYGKFYFVGGKPVYPGAGGNWVINGLAQAAGIGPENPNWKHAIEPRPETHK